MNLRDLIAQPEVVNEEVVEHEGQRFLFRGRPDANVMVDTVLMRGDLVEKTARHWGRFLGREVSPGIVKHVKAVHATLVPSEWDDDEKEWRPLETPYDVVEVARLACTHGALFMLMIGAAYQVLGLSEADAAGRATAFEEIAAGNSEEQAATS